MNITDLSNNACLILFFAFMWVISETMGLTSRLEPNSVADLILIYLRRALKSQAQNNEGEEKER